jgi:hypothetical protein
VALAQKIAARLKVMPEGEAHVAHAIAVCEEQRELGLSPLFYLAGRPSLYHSRPGFVPGLSFSELIVSFSSLPRGRADVRAAISGSGIFLPAPKGPVPRSGCPLNRDLTRKPRAGALWRDDPKESPMARILLAAYATVAVYYLRAD